MQQNIEPLAIVDPEKSERVGLFPSQTIGEDFLATDNFLKDIDLTKPGMRNFEGKIIKNEGISTIFICVEGEVEMVNNCQTCLLHAGDATYAQSGSLGEVKRFEPNTRFCLVMFRDSFYIPPLSAVEAASVRRVLVSHPSVHLDTSQFEGCVMSYKMLSNAIAKRDEIPYTKPIVQALVQVMVFRILSAYQAEAAQDSSSYNSRREELFSRFTALVQKHYISERGLAFYADKLCVTPKYLSQVIYKASGTYAADLIDNYVMGEAKALIKSHKYTIAQVSDMLNFTSQAYFGRFFKKHTGMTPTEFEEKG